MFYFKIPRIFGILLSAIIVQTVFFTKKSIFEEFSERFWNIWHNFNILEHFLEEMNITDV